MSDDTGTELFDEVKTFIVGQLACYCQPSEIVKEVKEQFGLDLTRQKVHRYDPTKAAGKDVSAKLKAIFDETRKAYLEDKAAIGIAQPAFRMRMYDRIARAAETRGNVAMALQACEQAAKEGGGAYTNHRVHELAVHDVPLTASVILSGHPDTLAAKDLTDDQRRMIAAQDLPPITKR
jgi:hypothetical protein